mgnify:FL=1
MKTNNSKRDSRQHHRSTVFDLLSCGLTRIGLNLLCVLLFSLVVTAPVAANEDLMKLGGEAYERGDYAAAVRIFAEASVRLTAELGERHPSTLRSGNNLAKSLIDTGRPDEALPLIQRVVALRTEVLGPRSPDTMESIDLLAWALCHSGRLAECTTQSERLLALRMEVQGEDHKETLDAMNNLALAYYLAGRFSEQIELGEKALQKQIVLLGERQIVTIDTMSTLAWGYWSMGRFGEHLRLAERVLQLCSELFGESNPRSMRALDSLANGYSSLGRFEDSLALQKRALERLMAISGEDTLEASAAIVNLARTFWAVGRHTEGLAMSERAFALHARIAGERHPVTLRTMGTLARAYGAVGRPDEARVLLERTIALRAEVQGERHLSTLQAMGDLASLYGELGRQDDRVALETRLLVLRGEVLGDRHPDTLASLANLAQAYAALQRPGDALQLSERFIAGAEWQRAQPGLSATNRRSLFQVSARAYRDFSRYHGLVGDTAQGFRLAELSKARTLLDGMTAQRAARFGALPKIEQDALEASTHRLVAIDQQIAQAHSTELRQELETSRNALVRTHEERVASLKAAYPRYATLTEPRLASAADLKPLLGAHTVALSYLTTPTGETSVWVVDGTTAPRFFDLGTLPHLATAVEILRRASAHPGGLKEMPLRVLRRAWRLADGSFRLLDAHAPAPAEGAHEVIDESEVAAHLSDTLLLPLAEALHGKTAWVISPDGALAQLPFELLPLGGRRVVEAAEMHYAQSLSVYALSRARQDEYRGLVRPKDLLAVGNPEYEAKAAPAADMRTRGAAATRVLVEEQLKDMRHAWPPLPGSEREIAAIRRLLPNSDVLLQRDASEEALQRANASGSLTTYRYLHFAVHGNLSMTDPALSSLVLSQVNLNPDTDGHITAAEWPGYNLRSDLTVLSACETGLGKSLSGEGVMGLPFALFAAGNVNTLLSLWPVFDDVTPKLMEKFFARLIAGHSAASALSATKREMAADPNPRIRHPSSWAGFVLVGAG